jgi:hypothetical protein
MGSKITSRPISLIVFLVFYIASAIVFWKMIEDGPTTPRLIAAVAFAVAGVLWTLIYFRAGKVKD